MIELTQNLKNGQMTLMEMPFPLLQKGQILVRNAYSIISAGTEGKTVKDARLGYLGKARARRDELGKVLQSARTLGPLKTYRMVMNRLETPVPLGYSSSGVVIAVASDVHEFKPGDYVACGGGTANHAEVIAVPVNLCVRLKSEAELRAGAMTTLGAIALQGIRQAEVQLGEQVVVIGLGLVGQLSLQLLHAAGVQAIGIDISDIQVDFARKHSPGPHFNTQTEGLNQKIEHLCNGQGADAVIITASSTETGPINLAGELCRKKGKVIVVGSVPTGFERKIFYQKELELKMSASYGPGRYDREYEEDGIDYPYAYVRWTENRNMQAFAELLHYGKIQPDALITHEFAFESALEAYDLIINRNESFQGVLLRYNAVKADQNKVVYPQRVKTETLNVSFIGGGSFAQNMLLPALKNKVGFSGILTARPHTASHLAKQYGFKFSTAESDEIFTDKETDCIFIVTRHDSHYEYVLKALQNNKDVFVEKPLCLRPEELTALEEAYQGSRSRLMVGFNRRFAPLSLQLKSALQPDFPIAMHYRINAGEIAAGHWIQNSEIGGGRLIGEGCHFIDYCCWLTGSSVRSISARSIPSGQKPEDSFQISLSFANGSIASISYWANGSKSLPKEFIEVSSGGVSYQLDDFRSLHRFTQKKASDSHRTIDKGHANCVESFLKSIREGKESPIPATELFNSMRLTFTALDSIRSGGENLVV